MINPIKIEKTANSPEVILNKDNNIFQIIGRSIVENSYDFYTPILNWFEEYFKNPNPSTQLSLYIDYLNSSSTLQIMKLIKIFNDKPNVKVVWVYEEGDENSRETGEEYELASNVKFEFIETDIDSFEDFKFDF